MRKKARQRKSRQKRLRVQTKIQLKSKGYIRRAFRGLLSPRGLFWETVALLICVSTAYYFFRSNVTVEIDTSLDPKNAIATLFRITNRSVVFPIYNVTRWMHVNVLYNSVSNSGFENSGHKPILPKPHVPKLGPGESTALRIPLGAEMIPPTGREYYTDADIEILVSYKTALLRRICTQHFRFEAHTGTDGIIHWFPKALSEPIPHLPDH
jgi:hypothetical protein